MSQIRRTYVPVFDRFGREVGFRPTIYVHTPADYRVCDRGNANSSRIAIERERWHRAHREYFDEIVSGDCFGQSDIGARFKEAADTANFHFQCVEDRLRYTQRSSDFPSPSFPFTSDGLPRSTTEYTRLTGRRAYSIYRFGGSRFGDFTGAEGQSFIPRYPGHDPDHPDEIAAERRDDQRRARARQDRLETERAERQRAVEQLENEALAAAIAEERRTREEYGRAQRGLRYSENRSGSSQFRGCDL